MGRDTGHTSGDDGLASCLLSITTSLWLGSRAEGTPAQEGWWLRRLASCSDSLDVIDGMGGNLAR